MARGSGAGGEDGRGEGGGGGGLGGGDGVEGRGDDSDESGLSEGFGEGGGVRGANDSGRNKGGNGGSTIHGSGKEGAGRTDRVETKLSLLDSISRQSREKAEEEERRRHEAEAALKAGRQVGGRKGSVLWGSKGKVGGGEGGGDESDGEKKTGTGGGSMGGTGTRSSAAPNRPRYLDINTASLTGTAATTDIFETYPVSAAVKEAASRHVEVHTTIFDHRCESYEADPNRLSLRFNSEFLPFESLSFGMVHGLPRAAEVLLDKFRETGEHFTEDGRGDAGGGPHKGGIGADQFDAVSGLYTDTGLYEDKERAVRVEVPTSWDLSGGQDPFTVPCISDASELADMGSTNNPFWLHMAGVVGAMGGGVGIDPLHARSAAAQAALDGNAAAAAAATATLEAATRGDRRGERRGDRQGTEGGTKKNPDGNDGGGNTTTNTTAGGGDDTGREKDGNSTRRRGARRRRGSIMSIAHAHHDQAMASSTVAKKIHENLKIKRRADRAEKGRLRSLAATTAGSSGLGGWGKGGDEDGPSPPQSPITPGAGSSPWGHARDVGKGGGGGNGSSSPSSGAGGVGGPGNSPVPMSLFDGITDNAIAIARLDIITMWGEHERHLELTPCVNPVAIPPTQMQRLLAVWATLGVNATNRIGTYHGKNTVFDWFHRLVKVEGTRHTSTQHG